MFAARTPYGFHCLPRSFAWAYVRSFGSSILKATALPSCSVQSYAVFNWVWKWVNVYYSFSLQKMSETCYLTFRNVIAFALLFRGLGVDCPFDPSDFFSWMSIHQAIHVPVFTVVTERAFALLFRGLGVDSPFDLSDLFSWVYTKL